MSRVSATLAFAGSAACAVHVPASVPSGIETVVAANGSRPLVVSSNEDRTAFYVDGVKVGVGRTLRILVSDAAHTIAAEPAGYRRKEEVFRPPFDDVSTYRFTFMLEDRVSRAADAFARPGYEGGPTAKASIEPSLVLPTRAREQANGVALIVGVGRYRDLTPALGADRDAAQYHALAVQTLGIPESNVKVLVDDHATRGDIDDALEWVREVMPRGGRLYFFYSGHGAPDPVKGTPFIVPYDGNPAALERSALPLENVLARLQAAHASETLAVIDSCFSGSGGRSVLPRGARPLVLAKPVASSGSVLLLTATTGAQIAGPASDESGGLFTQAVIDGVGRGQADVDGDGSITLEELHTWITPRVQREARKARREQTPGLTTGNVSPKSFAVVTGVVTR